MQDKKALVIQHLAFEGLGTLEPALTEAGYSIEIIHAGDLSSSQAQPELLIILGGPIGVYENSEYPFLNLELDFIQHRLQHQLPILGICLGAQLIARTLGASVFPGNYKEIGWSKLTNPHNLKTNPIAPLFEGETQVLHWHGDTFDLPEGATRLASSEHYENQAFSIGKHCLGLQFHPEVMELGMEKWFVGHACEISQTTMSGSPNYAQILMLTQMTLPNKPLSSGKTGWKI